MKHFVPKAMLAGAALSTAALFALPSSLLATVTFGGNTAADLCSGETVSMPAAKAPSKPTPPDKGTGKKKLPDAPIEKGTGKKKL